MQERAAVGVVVGDRVVLEHDHIAALCLCAEEVARVDVEGLQRGAAGAHQLECPVLVIDEDPAGVDRERRQRAPTRGDPTAVDPSTRQRPPFRFGGGHGWLQ